MSIGFSWDEDERVIKKWNNEFVKKKDCGEISMRIRPPLEKCERRKCEFTFLVHAISYL